MTSPWFGPDTAGTPTPPPAATPRFRRRDILITAALALVLLVGAGSAVAAGLSHDGSHRAAAGSADPTTAPAPPVVPATPAPSAAATGPARLDDVLPGMEAFVAKERGLPFLRPVRVELLDDAAFTKALTSGPPTAEEQRQQDGFVSTLLALGLVESRDDADQAIDNVDDVLGFYDDETQRLCVRAGKGLTPYAQGTLVHELTHALQDQTFTLYRPDIEDADDERYTAFSALVEGDATRIERAWYDDQPREVRKAYDTEEKDVSGSADDDYSVIDELGYFPYAAGPDLVDALLHEGGQARLDEAFRHPLTTTEQVYDIDAPAPVAVPAPSGNDDHGVIPPGGKVVDSGTLGEQGVALLLGEDSSDPDVATLWRGDRYVTTEVDGRLCTRADIAAANPGDATRLRKELDDYYDGVFTVDATVISVRTCVDDHDRSGGTHA